jgi:ABC-type glycerol-3-phosphate transport system substrate-binding protein
MVKAILGAVLAVAILGGCSGGSGTDAKPPTTPDATTSTMAATTTTLDPNARCCPDFETTTTTEVAHPSLEDGVRAYTVAFLGGDAGAAYALLTERCHGEEALADFKAIVDQGHDQYGDAVITSYAEDVNGTTATVTYELSDPILNQTNERWILESGGWHNDEC